MVPIVVQVQLQKNKKKRQIIVTLSRRMRKFRGRGKTEALHKVYDKHMELVEGTRTCEEQCSGTSSLRSPTGLGKTDLEGGRGPSEVASQTANIT